MTASTKSPVMGLAEAARVCGVSVSTIRRKRLELAEHGAAQTAKGWQIPVTALIAVGLMERVTPPPETPSEEISDASDAPADVPLDALGDSFRQELDMLRSQLADAERRAAVAEAVAAERDRIIQVQQMSLRMLEVGSTTRDPASALGAPRNPTVSQEHLDEFPEPATPPGNTKEGVSTTKGAPQGAPLWRRLIGRR